MNKKLFAELLVGRKVIVIDLYADRVFYKVVGPLTVEKVSDYKHDAGDRLTVDADGLWFANPTDIDCDKREISCSVNAEQIKTRIFKLIDEKMPSDHDKWYYAAEEFDKHIRHSTRKTTHP